MTKEIKFNEMYYSDKSESFEFGESGFIGVNHIGGDWSGSLNQMLMQFTGLKDKNGKEIYVGDIIRDESSYSDGSQLFVIKHDLPFFWFENSKGENCGFGKEIDLNCKIIGNIYKNPELLKK